MQLGSQNFIIIIYLFKVHRDKQLQWCMLIEQDVPGYI